MKALTRAVTTTAWAAMCAGLDVLIPLVIRVLFRRCAVGGREHVPRRGAVLVVCNHPATWTDGILLRIALRRRVHFLVHEELFRPAWRGAMLSAYGALPLHHRGETPDADTRNAATTIACERAFGRGEIVATFPEGVSRGDWRVEPFKTGAAWLALGHRGPLTVLPVGFHYRDRTAFRSEVEVSIGAPVDPAAFHALPDPSAAAHALTERLFTALTRLVVQASCPEVEALAKALMPMVQPRHVAGTLVIARALVAALDRVRAARTARLAELRRRVACYRRMRMRLGVPDAVLRDDIPPHEGWVGRAIVLVVGLAPAFAGWAIHAIPAGLTEWLVRRYAWEPSRVAFGRVTAGFVLFPAMYAVWVTLLWRAHVPVTAFPVFVLIGVLLGFVSLAYRGAWRDTVPRVRLAWLERRKPQAVARVRAARAAVIASAGLGAAFLGAEGTR